MIPNCSRLDETLLHNYLGEFCVKGEYYQGPAKKILASVKQFASLYGFQIQKPNVLDVVFGRFK